MQTIDLNEIEKEKTENHTSKGNQPKWHIKDQWYKADHMGYEALAEYVISELLKKSDVGDFVEYQLVKICYDNKESIGCVSKDFKEKDEMLIPVEKLHRQYYGMGLADAIAKKYCVQDKISYTVNFMEEITGLKDVGKYFSVMLTVDAFFLNEDRHTNNIAVLRDEKTKTFRFAPIFDHGLSLLSDTNEYSLREDVYDSMKKVQAKPFAGSFDEQLDAAEELYGYHLKFDFTRRDVYDILGRLNGVYDEETVRRVEKILFEQMRRYPYLWK